MSRESGNTPIPEQEPAFQEYAQKIVSNLDELDTLLSPDTFRASQANSVELNRLVTDTTANRRPLDSLSSEERTAIVLKARKIQEKIETITEGLQKTIEGQKPNQHTESIEVSIERWLSNETSAEMKNLVNFENSEHSEK